ncbi:MAG: ferritin-like domain-containing protein [Alphaproteobacteria bacterium]
MPLWTAMTLWTPNDIPWHRFDRSRVDPDLVKLVKAASMVEHNARDYAAYLCNVFHDDPAFQKLAQDWAEAEVQHGRTLGRWAALADPDFDFQARFKRYTDGFRVPIDVSTSVRGSLTGELLARCVVETGTSSHYTAIRQATSEPVLHDLCGRIAADELRHYKTFYELSKRYLEMEQLGLGSRLRVVVGRIVETQDEELAYAYYAANDEEGPFDRGRSNRAYVRRAYALYQPYLVERIGAMLLKVVGLRPHGRLNRLLARLAYRFMQRRVRRLAAQDA